MIWSDHGHNQINGINIEVVKHVAIPEVRLPKIDAPLKVKRRIPLVEQASIVKKNILTNQIEDHQYKKRRKALQFQNHLVKLKLDIGKVRKPE